MNLKNGYKALYEIIENREDGKYRTFKASKTGTFADTKQEQPILEVKAGTYKFVYEKDGKIYGSTTSIPAADSNGQSDFCFTDNGFDAVLELPSISISGGTNTPTQSPDQSILFTKVVTPIYEPTEGLPPYRTAIDVDWTDLFTNKLVSGQRYKVTFNERTFVASYFTDESVTGSNGTVMLFDGTTLSGLIYSTDFDLVAFQLDEDDTPVCEPGESITVSITPVAFEDTGEVIFSGKVSVTKRDDYQGDTRMLDEVAENMFSFEYVTADSALKEFLNNYERFEQDNPFESINLLGYNIRLNSSDSYDYFNAIQTFTEPNSNMLISAESGGLIYNPDLEYNPLDIIGIHKVGEDLSGEITVEIIKPNY